MTVKSAEVYKAAFGYACGMSALSTIAAAVLIWLFVLAVGCCLESVGIPHWRVGSMMLPLAALLMLLLYFIGLLMEKKPG